MNVTNVTLVNANLGKNFLPALSTLNAGTTRGESLTPAIRIKNPDLFQVTWPVNSGGKRAGVGTRRFWGINE